MDEDAEKTHEKVAAILQKRKSITKSTVLEEPGDALDTQSNAANTVTTNTKQVEWSPENELIIVEWCDVAQCYKWLNSRAHSKYSFMHAWFTIPAIVLSTVSGTASFAQTSIPIDYQPFAPMIIGSINILIGILTTIQQYLKISELNEAHRVSSISWDKFARNIRIELAKAPCERMDAGHFLKLNRQEFDRLMETSPSIPDGIIAQFKTKFEGKKDSDERKRFDALRKPDICDIIVTANETRHHWYLELNKSLSMDGQGIGRSTDLSEREGWVRAKEADIESRERAVAEKEEQKRQAALESQRVHAEKQKQFTQAVKDAANMSKQQKALLDDFVKIFEASRGRLPLKDEIEENFKDDVRVNKQLFGDLLAKYEKNAFENLPL